MYKISDIKNTIIHGDTLEELKKLPDDLVDTIITSPPYWGLRNYGVEGQIGLEKTLEEYIEKLLAITNELKRVLKPTGVMFWNHGDCYSGGKTGRTDDYIYKNAQQRTGGLQRKPTDGVPSKCLVLQNYRLILKMIDQGWILRNNIIWNKPNHMPSSVKDRFANSFEPVFMLVKNKKYWFDLDAVRVAITTFENRPMGIERERDYPNAKRNKNAFNYRVREAKKGHTGIIGVKSSKEEMERYNKKGQTKIPESQAETFGSPRARSYRIETNKKHFNKKGSGGNYDYGGIDSPEAKHENPKGKNPGDVWKIPIANYYVEFDGKVYKVSPDCPIHSPYLGREIPQKVFYDGQQDFQKNHISDISKNHGQELVSESASTLFPDDEKNQTKLANGREQIAQNISENKTSELSQQKEQPQNHRHIEDKKQKLACNLDYFDHDNSRIAISHNKQKSKKSSLKVLDDNASDKIVSHKSDKKQSYQDADLDLPYLNFNSAKCKCQEVQVDHLATKPDIWRIPTQPYKNAHFATFPEKLIEPMILSSCPKEIGIALDPFMGSGTVAIVAKRLSRNYLGIELSREYIKIAKARIKAQPTPLL